MNPESLSKLAQAMTDAPDVPDEDKAEGVAFLASGFAEDPSDDEVNDAINDAGMREEFDAADDDAKKATKDKFSRLLKAQKARAFAAIKPTPAKAEGKDAVPTAAQFKSMIAEAVTKALPPQGRHATTKANPTETQAKTGAAGFSAKIKNTMSASGVNRAAAIQILAQTDRAGFNEWAAAGRPTE